MVANIHIEGSSRMSREEFLAALPAYYEAAQERGDNVAVTNYLAVRYRRSTRSLLREWAAHKLCYALHIKRSSTESVDLDWPQAWYFRLGYFVIGGLALIFY